MIKTDVRLRNKKLSNKHLFHDDDWNPVYCDNRNDRLFLAFITHWLMMLCSNFEMYYFLYLAFLNKLILLWCRGASSIAVNVASVLPEKFLVCVLGFFFSKNPRKLKKCSESVFTTHFLSEYAPSMVLMDNSFGI